MKAAVMIGYVWVCVLSAAVAGEPAPFSIDRYRALMNRSAFAPASEGDAPAAKADFAKDFVLTGVVRFNGGELVTIASRDQKQQFGLSQGQNHDGITVAGVAWSDAQGRTRVTLKRGGQYAVIGFDEAAGFPVPKAASVSAPAAPPAAQPKGPPVFPANAAPRVIVP